MVSHEPGVIIVHTKAGGHDKPTAVVPGWGGVAPIRRCSKELLELICYGDVGMQASGCNVVL